VREDVKVLPLIRRLNMNAMRRTWNPGNQEEIKEAPPAPPAPPVKKEEEKEVTAEDIDKAIEEATTGDGGEGEKP
jgi:hypothetical protein